MKNSTLNLKNIRIVAIATIMLFVCVAVPCRVSAAEISPSESTYTYGSTSEYSAAEPVQVLSANQLVNTGSSISTSKLIIGSLSMLLVVSVILISIKSRRYAYKYRFGRKNT